MRDRIIRASIENLRREDLKFSVDTLTAQLKISKKTIYKYFPDKEALAVATAPAPALSIVNEYHTSGPVTKTLIPLAAIDNVIGVVVFFTVISVISAAHGASAASPLAIVGIVLFPFAIGIAAGFCASFLMKHLHSSKGRFALLLAFLCISVLGGLLIDRFLFHDFYILSRAAGKIGGAFLGGKLTKAEPAVTKYLGFTLLPHSGVSLVFTGIAVGTLTPMDASLASVISGTIVAAAILSEIIAVVIAKFAFKWADEIQE